MTMPTSPLSRLPVGDSRAGRRAGTRAPTSSSPIRPARTSAVSAIGVSVGPESGWACDARHCGRRPFLHDDLDVVTLDRGLVQAPPLELWPTFVPRGRLPGDVKTQLVQPLAASSARNEAH